MSNKYWTLEQAENQVGRTAIVTGANVGLGYETALALAGIGATVILACRNQEKAAVARAQILAVYPNALVECAALDTSSLDSVRAFATDLLARHDRCD